MVKAGRIERTGATASISVTGLVVPGAQPVGRQGW